MSLGEIRVGTAGWSLPAPLRPAFPGEGTLLHRYAARLSATEINTSFYRPHRPATYARWAAGVPAAFRFAVKVPRTITHERRLAGCDDLLARFLAEAGALGDRLGPLLVQLPPSLAFGRSVATAFLTALRATFGGLVVAEPRHPSWFVPAAEDLLAAFEVARVGADPAPVPAARRPGGWPGLVYLRLHGSPHVYHSAYGEAALAAVRQELDGWARRGVPAWCIFDNTALGHALEDALAVMGAAGDA